MITHDTIFIKLSPSNITYWKSLNYLGNISDTIKVSIKDIKKHSNYYVDCLCDICGEKYKQRISRNTDICSKCSSKKKMKGNIYGIKNVKYDIPDISNFEDLINFRETKKNFCERYNISPSVLNLWLKKYNIYLPKYVGNKTIKSDEDNQKLISKINELSKSNMSISEISNTLGITRSVLNTICKNNDIEITSKFDIWKNRFDNIMKNIEFYVSENKTKTLLDISIENNISIETLKKVFNLTGNKVKLHSYNKSKGELECKNFIKEIGMECHSVKFDKKFEIDCFVDSNKFGVEYCGEYWHSYNVNGNKKYHQEKFEYFKSNGIRIFTVFECEWKYKNDIVRSMISSRLNVASRIFARKCNIKQISPNMAKRFHTENHISGGINCSINIGLYYNDNLITVLSITKSRYDKTFEYEIGRYSTLKNHVVVGGLGKMFKYFVNQYSPKSCITYADLRFGEGKCYEKIGFCLSGMTPPNYYYFKKNGCGIESRVKYQKHKLKDMPGFDINKTEFEIMSDNGYYRIYDCGNNKYTWTNY